MVTKVNGGVLTDKSLSGGLQHFILYGVNFGYVISDGTITLDSKTSGPFGIDYYKLLGYGRAVPNSSVDIAMSLLSTKASIRQIGLVGDSIITEVHFCLDEHSNGWINEDGTVDVEGMEQAVRGLGKFNVPAPSGGSINDNTNPPKTQEVDMSNVRLEKVRYRLGRTSESMDLRMQTVTLDAPQDRFSLDAPITDKSKVISAYMTIKTDPETVFNMKYVDDEILMTLPSDYTLDLTDPTDSVMVINEEILKDFGYVDPQQIEIVIFTSV